jgi:hypothetical protein
MRKIMTALGVILALASFGGIVLGLQGYVATAADVREISERMDRHELEVRREALQKRIWNMEDRWAERYFKANGEYHDTIEELLAFMTKEARGVHRELTLELEEIDEQLARKKV